MSTAQILEELPKLSASDRSLVFECLAGMHETDLLDARGPSPAEREALDAALAEFERDPAPGEAWRDVFRELRASRL